MKIDAIDHLVLTVSNVEKSCQFYCGVLGMKAVKFNGDRWALKFGQQKINLHPVINSLTPKAGCPTPGATDICLLTSTSLDEVITILNNHSVSIIEGPVLRTGATGPIQSVYIRDPDDNLIEISNAVGNNSIN